MIINRKKVDNAPIVMPTGAFVDSFNLMWVVSLTLSAKRLSTGALRFSTPAMEPCSIWSQAEKSSYWRHHVTFAIPENSSSQWIFSLHLSAHALDPSPTFTRIPRNPSAMESGIICLLLPDSWRPPRFIPIFRSEWIYHAKESLPT